MVEADEDEDAARSSCSLLLLSVDVVEPAEVESCEREGRWRQRASALGFPKD